MKRVAWPPNLVTKVETIETHEFENGSGRIGMLMQQPPLNDAYFSQKLQQEANMFLERAEQQEETLIPPKIPPRVLPKPILRQTSDAQVSVFPLCPR